MINLIFKDFRLAIMTISLEVIQKEFIIIVHVNFVILNLYILIILIIH